MEKIKEILENLETKHDVKIIYAVEAGSRAWGLDSIDSDFDMRFIYVNRKNEKYLSLKPVKDTIDGFSDDRVYDWQGWDITKALKLIHTMNPSIVEWLYSPIVYKSELTNDFSQHAKKFIEEQKRITPLLFHYKSMAKSNYKAHIQNKSKVIPIYISNKV
jgi:predicted nucleotidyltransferase